ncbi:thioredoxin family protein [Novipirellula artificiosorum]|uniref:Thioredoxin n=1 Tax=Novipirellula artificiosorum TaxID=2528016 RepID=A0A5C6DZG6_9BACT|nr:thioredoxin family protein [Novipirellula artificiosorum]TWU42028.1 Thioredoxin [Novipirellula artificiosorum]
MVTLLLAVVLSGVTSEHPIQQKYATAYQESLRENKPLMVVVGAPWCPACNVLKNSTIKPMAQTGELDDVCVAVIDKDQDPELVEQLTRGEKMLPQIILFTKTGSGQWNRSRLMGFQPKQPIRSLIQKAIMDRQG